MESDKTQRGSTWRMKFLLAKESIVAALVFGILFGATIFVYFGLQSNFERERYHQFQLQTERITALIQDRMNLYTNVLYGVKGLFATSKHVSEDEWNAYAQALDLLHNYAGISTLLYIQRVPQEEAATVPFDIHPQKSEGDYYPFTYAAIASSTAPLGVYFGIPGVIGFDASSDPVRREAMLRAAQTGAPVASAVVESAATGMPIFTVFVPVYETPAPIEQTETQVWILRGYVGATFRLDKLFKELSGGPLFDPAIGLAVYDAIDIAEAGEETLLFKTAAQSIPSGFQREEHLTVAGRPWTLVFTEAPGFSMQPTGTSSAILVLIAGTIVSAVLASFLFLFLASRRRSIELERDELEESKSDFVTLASHQLRTPLTVIRWFTEMLRDEHMGSSKQTQEGYLQEIEKGGERMEDLIGDLLDVSRLEVGSVTVEPEPLDLARLSHQILEKERNKVLREKRILTHEKYTLSDGVAQYDKSLMTIIFKNLFSNACKYTPSGGDVSVSIEHTPKEFSRGEGILMQISDTGYGIPQNQKQKVFSKLFRAENIKTKDTTGTGLGLYITWLILKRVGGDIWFESVENKGTTFYVWLPPHGMQAVSGDKRLVV